MKLFWAIFGNTLRGPHGFFPKTFIAWYVNLAEETLALIREGGSVVEVNTRGIYKQRSDSLFPGPELLKKILSLNIPITLTSDAHKPAELSAYFTEAKELLKGIGFNSLRVLTSRGWQEAGL